MPSLLWPAIASAASKVWAQADVEHFVAQPGQANRCVCGGGGGRAFAGLRGDPSSATDHAGLDPEPGHVRRAQGLSTADRGLSSGDKGARLLHSESCKELEAIFQVTGCMEQLKEVLYFDWATEPYIGCG